MVINKFSEKQLQILDFAFDKNNALICDGAVRSGKTLCMTFGFILWAMSEFDRCNFAICGKTVTNAERNILKPFQQLEGLPYSMTHKVSSRILTVKCGKKENYFYLYGGKDESSYMLIQGITLAGVLLDEVALMPRSFVDQAIARTLTFKNAKIWFNCNPESPNHWFYTEWIKAADKGERKAKHLHFLMQDNPIMGEEEIKKAEEQFSGVFYDRYIKGLWVIAEGLIYPMFSKDFHVKPTASRPYQKHYISIDYGTMNPCSMGLWGLSNGAWYRIKEYYHNGRKTTIQKTDEEYYDELVKLAGDLTISKVIVDPAAASFIACIKKHGKFRVEGAKNDVLNGIQNVATHLKKGDLLFNDCCKDSIMEFRVYSWDEKAKEDRPIKDNDHAMDDIRYFVNTILDNKHVAQAAKGFLGGF